MRRAAESWCAPTSICRSPLAQALATAAPEVRALYPFGPDDANLVLVKANREQLRRRGRTRSPRLLGKKGVVSSELSMRQALSGVLFLSQSMGLIIAAIIGAFAAAFVWRATATAVAERRREMAILQAIGWSWRHIREQVLIENLALAIIGTAAGLVLALVVVLALGHVSVTVDLPWDLSSTPHFIPQATIDRTQTITAPMSISWLTAALADGRQRRDQRARGSGRSRLAAAATLVAAAQRMKEPRMSDTSNARKVRRRRRRRARGGEPAIRVEGVRKRYGDLEVLKGVDLTVAAGQFTAIMGKSGSGKSTLLGVIAGLEKPDAGEVFIMGQKLAGMSDRDMAELRRRSIGIVFQGFSLIPSLTALDNVLLPAFFATETTRRASAASAPSISCSRSGLARG